MPVLAFTFLGSWQINQDQAGGAPRAVVSFGDTSSGGYLNINMGSYSARQNASSTVTATRDFRVSSSGEAVTIARSIETILKNAYADVSVKVQRVTGSSTFSFPEFNRFVGSRPRYFQQTDSRTRHMSGGVYRLVISVKNVKDRTGSWTSVSPYQFTFNGVGGNGPRQYGDWDSWASFNPFFVQPAFFD
jgi:hypothetical protein